MAISVCLSWSHMVRPSLTSPPPFQGPHPIPVGHCPQLHPSYILNGEQGVLHNFSRETLEEFLATGDVCVSCFSCVGVEEEEAPDIDIYHCPNCEKTHGKSTCKYSTMLLPFGSDHGDRGFAWP